MFSHNINSLSKFVTLASKENKIIWNERAFPQMIKFILSLKKKLTSDLVMVTSHIDNFLVTAVTTSNSNFMCDRN